MSTYRYKLPFVVGATIRKLSAVFVDSAGAVRTDLASCTVKVVERDNPGGTALMSGSATVTAAAGLAEFACDWATAAATYAAMVYGTPLPILVQFTPTFTGGIVGPEQCVEGEIHKAV